jgi:polyisoprenyl-phosphate glycosyltransferase
MRIGRANATKREGSGRLSGSCITADIGEGPGKKFGASLVVTGGGFFHLPVWAGRIQLLCLGILGEYIGRIYDEVKRRPMWVVREQLGVGVEPVRSDQTK